MTTLKTAAKETSQAAFLAILCQNDEPNDLTLLTTPTY